VVELGVDTEVFKPDSSDQLSMISSQGEAAAIYTSSAWPEYAVKGMSVLVEALAGTGYKANLMAHTERENIAKGLKMAEIYVFPSIYEETFGLSLCEAMASGCACIASDVAGARAQIEHERTGLLVPKQDPQALRDAITRLVKDDELRRRLGQAAREHVVVHHSLEAEAERWVKVYREVIGEK
jgi:mannosyltransferase